MAEDIKTSVGWCRHWKRNAVFLYVLLPLLLVIVIFSANIMYSVYILGDSGARLCRSIVLLTLIVMVGVALVCVRLARSSSQVKLFCDTADKEFWVLAGIVLFFFVLAWVLGIGDEVSLKDDLENNPFKMITSRCQPTEAWSADLLLGD